MLTLRVGQVLTCSDMHLRMSISLNFALWLPHFSHANLSTDIIKQNYSTYL